MGNILSQNQQNEYFEIWKSLVMNKSAMSESYFDAHIVDYKISSIAWNAGVSFRIDYQLKIDWMTINCQDEFLVTMNSSYEAFEHLNIPRDVNFDESQIDFNINNMVHSEISSYNLLDQLKYNNCDELKTAIKDSTGYQVAVPDRATYYVPGKLPREDGDPYVLIIGTINNQENKCLKGHINLNTGEWEAWEDVCVQ
ncbi:hypothetical protein [Brumimicrobium oceani]|nr:hypothetical protein [Brumimicrobium oceani]